MKNIITQEKNRLIKRFDTAEEKKISEYGDVNRYYSN